MLSVIFYHAGIKYFKGGWLGVDLFFVISGYLISNIIFSELVKGKFSFKNFYVRRIRRILPALFMVYLVSLPLTYIFLQPKATIEFISSLISSVFFISNIYFRNLDFYISEPAKLMPLIHTWSLSIEEQFYIIFPIVALVLFKVSKKYLFFLIASLFLFSIFLNSTIQTYDKFYFLQYRAWELLLGVLIMLIGKFQYSKFLSTCGFVLMLIPIFYFDDSWINDIEPKILSLFGLSLFLIFNSEQSSLTKFLSLKFISFSGLISYSLYLYHQPVFVYIRHFKLRELESVTNSDLFLGFLITYLLSYFSWKYIENYFLKNQNYKLLFSYLVSILIVIITFSVIGYQTNGYEKRYDYVPEEVIYYSINTNLYPSTNEIDLRYWKFYDCGFQKNYLADTVSKDPLCNKYFNKKNKKTIYLVGDSHVNYLTVSFLREIGDVSNEYDLVSVGGTAGRCLISGQHDSSEYEPSCNKETFNKFIKKLDKQNDIVVIIGRINIWLSETGRKQIQCENCNFISELKNRVNAISQSSEKVILVKPVPTFEFPIAKSYLYKHYDWGESITIDYFDWKDRLTQTELFLEDVISPNLFIVKTDAIFCNNFELNKCNASYKNKIFYTDTNHLTLDGAGLITDEIKLIIKNN